MKKKREESSEEPRHHIYNPEKNPATNTKAQLKRKEVKYAVLIK